MTGKGTFQELSKSGVDFSSLLKHEEEEEKLHSPTSSGSHVIQRSVSHDPQSRLHDHSRLKNMSKSHEHINGHCPELRHRVHHDSTCSSHSVHASAAGSMMSLTSIGTEFEVPGLIYLIFKIELYIKRHLNKSLIFLW